MADRIKADPLKVEEVMRRMTQLTNEIREKEKQMKSYLSLNVPSQWNDVRYKAFMDLYEDFSKKIQRPLVDADQVIIPHLRNARKAIDEYNKMNRQ